MPREIEAPSGGQGSTVAKAGVKPIVLLIALTLAAGFADAATYLLVGSFTGHITGNTVLGGIALNAGKSGAFFVRMAAVAVYLLGTAAGILLPRLPRLPFGKNGALASALIVEAILVAVAPLPLFAPGSHTNFFILVCLCFALGLQNGIFKKSDGVSVHTTYISGDATSLLVSLLQKPSAGAPPQPDKAAKHTLLGLIWPSFAIGAVLAGFAVHAFGAHALWLLELPLFVATAFAWKSTSPSP